MSENIPDDLRYTKSHEWVRQAPAGAVEIGITDHAQNALGDLVFAEVPEVGRSLRAGEACAVVESVKAASDVYTPLGGTVIASNEALAARPELLNEEPYAGGWLFRLQVDSQAESAPLLSAAEYAKLLAKEAE